VVYDGIYPGVDLVYYGTQGRAEHDFIVAPGINPSVIALEVHGADQVAIDAQGDLVVTTGAGDVRLQKPVLYQDVDGQRRNIEGGYVLMAEQRVSFQVGAYDATQPLIIDPVLVYATYLGGNGADFGNAIGVDAAGHAYVTGFTTSLNFPVAGNSPQAMGGGVDAFVAKLNVAGTALVYATYLGGSGHDRGVGLAVDAAGQAYVAGYTSSGDFPVVNSPFQGHNAGGFDAFVAKLNVAGTALVYATYLGGSGDEYSFGLAVDAAGQAYVTGQTYSLDFPVAGPPPQGMFGGGNWDAFVAKIGTDTLPPEITVTATPATLWPPNGKLVTVTISGTIRDANSGVNASTTAYAVEDEYANVEPSGGPFSLGEDGSYSFTIDLHASRNGNDRDGRHYTITVSAHDTEGNEGVGTAIVTVPHDQGQGRSIAAR
jgi:hypothetical protein